jgi:predicted GIY-YIG superfamily endonuclease
VWNGEGIVRGSTQTEESFEEQRMVTDFARTKLDKYVDAHQRAVRNTIICGGPGNGKTTCTQVIAIMALSRGLIVTMTALMSIRAKQLGGRHISHLLCIPVHEYATPQRLAELAVMKLFRMPKLIAFLRQLDIMDIDELSLVSDKDMSIMDTIFRRVRDNNLFMGGVLTFATMDHLQPHAIQNRPALMSPHILTCFDILVLQHSVRASRCPPLRRMQQITRYCRSLLTSDIVAEFRSLLKNNCNFISCDADAPPHILRVFSKKVATRIAEQRLLESARRQYGEQIIIRQSEDVEATPEGCWVPATEPSRQSLDRNAKEPRELFFFPRALYEVTFNDPNDQFSQSQLALLCSVPTAEDVNEFRPLQVMIAPNGCQIAPPNCKSPDDLLAEGWQFCTIPVAPDRPHNQRYGIQAKRKQYGLRPRISNTIHASMGQDLGAIVTKVTSPTTDSRYLLWMPSQVVVLLSRTFYAKDIYFIGTLDDTTNALIHALQIQSQYTEYMSNLIQHLAPSLSSSSYTTTPASFMPFDLPKFFPFRIADLSIPNDTSGTVYLLLSLRDRKTTYIGQTKHLSKRILQHNTTFGSQQTADASLQPWALLAIICGFENNRTMMLRVEAAWQRCRTNLTAHEGPLSPKTICNLGMQLLGMPPYRHLRFVQCATLSYYRSSSNTVVQP